MQQTLVSYQQSLQVGQIRVSVMFRRGLTTMLQTLFSYQQQPDLQHQERYQQSARIKAPFRYQALPSMCGQNDSTRRQPLDTQSLVALIYIIPGWQHSDGTVSTQPVFDKRQHLLTFIRHGCAQTCHANLSFTCAHRSTT